LRQRGPESGDGVGGCLEDDGALWFLRSDGRVCGRTYCLESCLLVGVDRDVWHNKKEL